MGFKFEVNPNELKSGIRLETSPVGSACGGFDSDDPENLFFIVFVVAAAVAVAAHWRSLQSKITSLLRSFSIFCRFSMFC